LHAGDPADGADTWLRSVTNSTPARKGRVHHAEFKKWLGPPDDAEAKWKLELSGQLLLLVKSISADAKKRVESQQNKLKAAGKPVPSSLVFSGVLHNKVDAIRRIAVIACDVIYDPQPDNDAHANIVIFDKGLDEILTVTDALMENLIWLLPAQISADPILSVRP
jgi:hypothetical protein